MSRGYITGNVELALVTIGRMFAKTYIFHECVLKEIESLGSLLNIVVRDTCECYYSINILLYYYSINTLLYYYSNI